MFEECLKNEIFEGQAFNYIIKIDGTIVAGSGNSKKWGIGKNIFVTDASEDERDDDARDDDARDKMISDMKEGKAAMEWIQNAKRPHCITICRLK